MIEIPDIAVTHGGRFHADDVFAAALLRICNPRIRFRRLYAVPEDFSGLVFDIGGGAYDHHQAGAPVRENGMPYAAFGLLWREIGPELVGEEEALRMDEHFIRPMDLDDNTGCGHVYGQMVADFNPAWDSDEDPDACFEEAVRVAEGILRRRIERIRAAGRAEKLVRGALAEMEDGIVTLPRFAPWKPFLEGSEAEFLIYPSQRGGWNAQCVPIDGGEGALKCPFPAEWAGKTQGELEALTGISTLRFCHNSRFLAAAGTREDAIAACRLAQRKEHSHGN